MNKTLNTLSTDYATLDKSYDRFDAVSEAYQVIAANDCICWDVITSQMDDEIVADLHDELAPCSNEQFLIAYLDAHYNWFQEEFIIN